MSADAMTASEIRELLILAASNLLDMQASGPDVRPRCSDEEPLNLADSRAVAADLHRYVTEMSANDFRLNEVAQLRLGYEDLIDSLPDDGLIPARGDDLLAYILGRARSKRLL